MEKSRNAPATCLYLREWLSLTAGGSDPRGDDATAVAIETVNVYFGRAIASIFGAEAHRMVQHLKIYYGRLHH